MARGRGRKRKRIEYDLFGHPIKEAAVPMPGEFIPCVFDAGGTLRAMLIRGDYWFVAIDICRGIGIENVSRAVERLDGDEKMTLNTSHGHSRGRGGAKSYILVSEPGLYRLIMSAHSKDKPNVKRFQRWVTHEVLPSLRKTGSYTLRTRTRVEAEARRLGCDPRTAKVRCDEFALNSSVNKRIAEEGGHPRNFQTYHNAGYCGGFRGKKAKDLRAGLGMKRGTPLDRMDCVPLSINLCSKAIAERLIREAREAGSPMSFAEQANLLESIAREMTDREVTRFGPTAELGFAEHPRRGLILDVVKRQLEAS